MVLMKQFSVIAVAAILAVFLPAQPVIAAVPRDLAWEDLLPEGESVPVPGQAAHDIVPLFDDMGPGGMPPRQMGSSKTVAALDGAYVRMPGFALALEYAGDERVSELLLVPYFGACIHVPPPPPNQVVHVILDEPIKLGRLWDPVWITGIMRTRVHYNDLGNAAYTLEAESIETYDE